jgi:hypothetical protein
MTKRQAREAQQLTFCVQYIPVPDCRGRLCRAISIVLNSISGNAPEIKRVLSNMEERPAKSAISEGTEDRTTDRTCGHEG